MHEAAPGEPSDGSGVARPANGGLPPRRPSHLPERASHLRHTESSAVSADPERALRRAGRRSRSTAPKASPSFAAAWWAVGVVVLVVVTNWFSARFFYRSGLNAGMQRGLEARAEARLATGSDGAAGGRVFAALVNLRESDPDPAEEELIASLLLRELRRLPEDQLPATLRPGNNAAEDIAAAYVAMRLGDFGKAASILREAEPTMPPATFQYLMGDPAMREFAREPRVMGFY